MVLQTEKLYKLQKKDIYNAGRILNEAFQDDPLWLKLLENEPQLDQKRSACLEVTVRICIFYGEAYAISENLEGIICWIPGNQPEISIWRYLRCGALSSLLRVGVIRSLKILSVFNPLNEYRIKLMKGKNYLYGFIVGISSNFKGEGYGKKLLQACIEKSESEGIPIYTETETEENVKLFEHLGFKLINKILLPKVNMYMWVMLREPRR